MAKTKEAFRKTKGDIYILAASAFGNEGKILEELKNETHQNTPSLQQCT